MPCENEPCGMECQSLVDILGFIQKKEPTLASCLTSEILDVQQLACVF